MDTPTPKGWQGPADKGAVLSRAAGRLGVDQDDPPEGDAYIQAMIDRRNCEDL